MRLLEPRTVDARVGNRDMDVRHPGAGLPGISDPQLGGVLRLGGALKVPDTALDADELAEQQLYENWDQPYPHPFQSALAALINLADDYGAQTAQAAHGSLESVAASFAESETVTAADPDPLVTPPLYGRWHALTSRLLTEPDGTPQTPNDNWVHELNLDPRFRVPAGTGGRIVRAHEEEFMQAAWEQLGDVLEANKRIRAAQFAREVGYVHHANHLEPLRQAASGQLLTVTALLQSRVVPAAVLAVGAPPPTVAASLADSIVGGTPLSAVMRRVTRPGSRLMRGLPFAPAGEDDDGPDLAASGNGSAPRRQDLLERINAGEVSAAPPKAVPPGVVSVDALEEELAGPIIRLGDEEPPGLVISDPVPNPVGTLPTSADFVISLPGEGVQPTPGGADSSEAARFKLALNDSYAAFNSAFRAGAAPPRTALDLNAAAEVTMAALHPDLTVPRRALGGIALPDRFLPPAGDGDEPPPIELRAVSLQQPDPLGEVMAYPVIDLPMFRPLIDMSPDLFCPNVNLVPPDSITLLETNPAVHRVLPGRPEPRDGPRAAVARVSDRPARHRLPSVLGRARGAAASVRDPRRAPRAAARHPADRTRGRRRRYSAGTTTAARRPRTSSW